MPAPWLVLSAATSRRYHAKSRPRIEVPAIWKVAASHLAGSAPGDRPYGPFVATMMQGLLRVLRLSKSKAPSLGRVRQPAGVPDWRGEQVLSGITPKRLVKVLKSADFGDFSDYLTAAQELEERDAQYGSQMSVRRAAVSSLELGVNANGASARATKAVEALVSSGRLSDLVPLSLDALGKGFAISQVVWTEKNGIFAPELVEHDQREFLWRPDDRSWRLRDGSLDGLELEENRWVIHEPRLRSGEAIRRGLARPAMFLHMAKWMSLAGWVTMMKLFGVPLAVAEIPHHATENDRRVLTAALANLGSGVNALVPTGANVTIIKAADAGSSPDRLFSVLLDYVDRQISKLVLGQTMTADDGSSHAQATVHNEVRRDIREGDAEQLAKTINRFVVEPYVRFNVGDQKVYPKVYFQQEDKRDLLAFSQAIVPLIRYAGLEVKADEVRKLFGLSAPEANDEILRLSSLSNLA